MDVAEPAGQQGKPVTWAASAAAASVTAPPAEPSSVRNSFDRLVHARLAKATFSLSPASLGQAYGDWLAHLSISPGKLVELAESASEKLIKLIAYGTRLDAGSDHPTAEPFGQDRRFASEDWQAPAFKLLTQGFLLWERWWREATTGVTGVSRHHEAVVSFVTRQWLDVFSPGNFLPTNPEAARVTVEQGGLNLLHGWQNLLEDWRRNVLGEPPYGTEAFQVAKDLAITPGKVVLRNQLIELIQYTPAGPSVYAEPVLIVPAWIMKYYILDLSPRNSLVRYLVEKGHTVFMISWKNPDGTDRDLSLEDYRELGVMAALEAIAAIVPDRKVHAVGYCIGGTLLALSAAAMARDRLDRLRTMTLFAAQTDFTEAGELMLFIDESQVAFLEDLMWDQGFLDSSQMAGAFQLLRSQDLIWSRMLHQYLLGERQTVTDLMAWNADTTRMPFRMHSEYLHSLFLSNDLAAGHYRVDDRPVSLGDIDLPIFAVGAETDHVAPWTSVYKINLLTDATTTFLLTSGGHNAGIISEPGHERRHYRIGTKDAGGLYVAPEAWFLQSPIHEGSWWPAWQGWLAAYSQGDMVAPPTMGAPAHGYRPLVDAPGTYVLQK